MNKNEQVNQNQVKVEEVQVVEQVQQANPETVPQVVVVQQQPKEGLMTKAKRHWKGLTAAALAVLAAAGSTVVAYKKGKTAGMNVPTMYSNDDDNDNSLNPNI